jgi:hypothetical protein
MQCTKETYAEVASGGNTSTTIDDTEKHKIMIAGAARTRTNEKTEEAGLDSIGTDDDLDQQQRSPTTSMSNHGQVRVAREDAGFVYCPLHARYV